MKDMVHYPPVRVNSCRVVCRALFQSANTYDTAIALLDLPSSPMLPKRSQFRMPSLTCNKQ